MLAILDTQINSIELELTALLAKVEEHRQQLKATKARQRKTTKLVDSLKELINELPSDAIANLRESVLSLFPSPQSPVTEPQEKLPIIEAIKEIEQNALPLTDAGKEPEVTRITFIPTPSGLFPPATSKLHDLGEKVGSQAFQQPEKPATDIPIATAPAELENAFSSVLLTDVKEEVQPEAEDLIATADAKTENPATTINEFCSLVRLNETVAYIRSNRGQMSGEIMSAYVGCSSQKLAKDWADCVKLWGATQTELRKPQRLTDAKWEVKIWGLPFHKLTRLAEFHQSLSEPVPSAPHSIEEAKKPESNSPNLKETSGDSSDTSMRSESEESKFYFTRVRDFDKLMPEYYCYLKADNKYVGRVKDSLSPNHQGRWNHDALRGAEWQTISFATQEEAAEDLLRRKQYAEQIHLKTNNEWRKANGFDELEPQQVASEDEQRQEATHRIDGYMQQLGWSKKQAKEFAIAKVGIDHRSKMSLPQLLQLGEAMEKEINQQAQQTA